MSRDQALEIIATAILALATITTVWSGYQAGRLSEDLDRPRLTEAARPAVENGRTACDGADNPLRHPDTKLLTHPCLAPGRKTGLDKTACNIVPA